ncbi:MAG: nucleotidyltransferase domain-containing protein [Prevotella sp.]|nr:nucleotidyltransferase domain-containing protein [Prevotella sp.]
MINSETGEFMGIRTSEYETLGKLKERPLLWERGADSVPEDVATSTITTIEPQQGDETSSRTKGQSNVSSASKGSNNSAYVQENEQENAILGLEGYSEEEIVSAIREDIEAKLEEAGVDGVTIKGIALNGSRMRGDANTDSDLDVVVEYDGEISEDGLFNILNENPITIEGVKVDINPITEGKSGTLDPYMERSRQYDAKKRAEGTEPNAVQERIDEETGNVALFHKASEEASEVSEQEGALRDALVETMRNAGIKVSVNEKEGLRVLDIVNGKNATLSKAQKRAAETASLNHTEGSPADISTADGAKVLNNLDELAKHHDNLTKNNAKTFLGDVAQSS